ncbi:MAG: hypothetical protein H7267_07255 [Sandarakinorhabdus sp.]|nr:hypothetical protein [Sandarakinorhabdus sp.]
MSLILALGITILCLSAILAVAPVIGEQVIMWIRRSPETVIIFSVVASALSVFGSKKAAAYYRSNS